jgi:hypothetical protein
LSVERRDIPQDDEVIALHVEHYQTTNYAFKINSDNWDSGIDTYIYDGHLNIYTVIEPNVPFNFTVDPGIPESLASDRFSLVFNPQNLGLDEESFQNAIIASPNPVAGAQLELNIPEHLSGNSAVIEIYNSTGQLLMHKTYAQITNSETLDLSGFEGGMYILSIKTDKYKQQLKLIKP